MQSLFLSSLSLRRFLPSSSAINMRCMLYPILALFIIPSHSSRTKGTFKSSRVGKFSHPVLTHTLPLSSTPPSFRFTLDNAARSAGAGSPPKGVDVVDGAPDALPRAPQGRAALRREGQGLRLAPGDAVGPHKGDAFVWLGRKEKA